MSHEVYVEDGLCTALLGHPTITAIGLVMRIEPVTMDLKPEIKKGFLKLFHGLGKLEGEYRTKLLPNANRWLCRHLDESPSLYCLG